MENLVGDRRHRHRAHAIAVLQDTKMVEDFAKERQIFLSMDPEIVWVPP